MKKIKRNLQKMKRTLRFIMFQAMNRYYSLRNPLQENKVLFLSDVREEIGGNLKYVYDYLEGSIYERVLRFKEDRNVKRTFREKIQLCYDLSTSKYIVLDDYSRFISLMKLRKGQEICQLWHGPGAFKKFGYSRQDKVNLSKANGHRNYTKACVTGEEIRWCYAEGFGMDKANVQAVGMPRTDDFFDQEYIKMKKDELYNEMPYLKEKKIILFAPTYRGTSLKKSYYDYEQLDVEKIYHELKDKGYVFIFKWHPGLYFQMQKKGIKPYEFEKYPDFFYDLSDSRDINELLLITDVLVTDYSSVIFDYALLNKPVVYFVYDYEKYQEDRGLYFSFEEYVYGKIAKNTEELVQAIDAHDMMIDKREVFNKKFISACDGHSTEKICKWLFGYVK